MKFFLLKGGDESPEARRERNAEPENRAARREYMRSEAGREANRKAKENYRERHPDRVRAHDAARSEHGSAAGHKCASCGKPAKHKHHASYKDSKVRWLCHTCHVKAHHPKSDLGEKSMTTKPAKPAFTIEKCDAAPAANEFQYTPFYVRALEIERDFTASPDDDKRWMKRSKALDKLRVRLLDWKIKQEEKKNEHVAKGGEEKTMNENELFKQIMSTNLFAKSADEDEDEKAPEAGSKDDKRMPPWMKNKMKAKEKTEEAEKALERAMAADNVDDAHAAMKACADSLKVAKALMSEELGDGLSVAALGEHPAGGAASDPGPDVVASGTGMDAPSVPSEILAEGDREPSSQMSDGPQVFDNGEGGAPGLAAVSKGGERPLGALAARTSRARPFNYSTSEDDRVAALMEKSGGNPIPNPALDNRLGMAQTHECGFCKSMTPSILSTCLTCGGDQHGAPAPSSSAFVEKSIAASVTRVRSGAVIRNPFKG